MTVKLYVVGSGHEQSDPAIQWIRFGTCEIQPLTREVFVNGQVCSMEPKVFDLLLYLIKERSRVISKDELLEHIWKGAFVSESVIARTIMKARKAIGDHMPDCPFIKTIHCVGYRFIPPVDIGYDTATPPADSIDVERLRISMKPYATEDRTV